MEDLSNELLLLIFTYLSQRQIKRCSLVNKKWYQLTHDPQSYKIITIYSESQLTQFIEFVKTNEINHKPIGYYVQRLYYYGRNLSSALFTSFHDVCPYVTFINEIDNIYSDESASPLLSLPQWHYLNHFNASYTYHYKDWMKQLNSKKKKILSLSFYVDMDKLENKKKSIQLEKDTRQQKRKLSLLKMSPLTQVFRQRINTYFDIREDHVYHYGKVLILPKLKYLTSLCLHFSSYAMKTVYDLDERTLESIFNSCPQLESLTLTNMEMNISNDYYSYASNHHTITTATTAIIPPTSSSSSSSSVSPSTTITYLAFINCNLHDAACYDYLSMKCPKLKTFSLIINRDDIYPTNEHHSFKTAIFHMITHFKDLTSLTLKINNTISQINDQFWPIQELQQWLNHLSLSSSLSSPSTLLHLNILDSFMGIKKIATMKNKNANDNIDIDDMKKNRMMEYTTDKLETSSINYFHYLKSLTLTIFTHTTTSILSYLLLFNHHHHHHHHHHHLDIFSRQQQIVSTSITSLNLDTCFTNHQYHQQNIIHLYQWLDAFPNLKKITLIGMNKITDRSQRNHHNKLIQNEEKEEEEEDDDDDKENRYQWQQRDYKLVELKIHDSSIDIKGGLSTLCYLFPHLTSLDLKNITFQHDLTLLSSCSSSSMITYAKISEKKENENEKGKQDDDESTVVQLYNTLNINNDDNDNEDNNGIKKMKTYIVDATHLDLDLLSLMYISYQPDMTQNDEMEMCSFTIQETVGSTRTFHFPTIADIIPFHLHFKCKSLEGLII